MSKKSGKRTVVLSVDFEVEMPADEVTSDVTFDIDVDTIRVDGLNKADIGRVLSYRTQENFE